MRGKSSAEWRKGKRKGAEGGEEEGNEGAEKGGGGGLGAKRKTLSRDRLW